MIDSLFGTKLVEMFTCFKTFDKYIGCFPLDFCFSRRRKLFPIFLSPILTSLKIWLQAYLDTQVVFRAKAFTISFFLSVPFYHSFSVCLHVKCAFLLFFPCLSACQMCLSTILSLFFSFLYWNTLLFPFFLTLSFCLKHFFSHSFSVYLFVYLNIIPSPFFLCFLLCIFSFYFFLYFCLCVSFYIIFKLYYFFVLLSTFQRLKSCIQSSNIQWWVIFT